MGRMAFMDIPACLLAELPKAVLTSKAPSNSLPPSPLRLQPAGATPCRAGTTPAENCRLFTAHVEERARRQREAGQIPARSLLYGRIYSRRVRRVQENFLASGRIFWRSGFSRQVSAAGSGAGARGWALTLTNTQWVTGCFVTIPCHKLDHYQFRPDRVGAWNHSGSRIVAEYVLVMLPTAS
jgi:hypothetical protein